MTENDFSHDCVGAGVSFVSVFNSDQAGKEICYKWQHLSALKQFKMMNGFYFHIKLPSALQGVRLSSGFKYAYLWKILPWWFSLLTWLRVPASLWSVVCWLMFRGDASDLSHFHIFYICILCSLLKALSKNTFISNLKIFISVFVSGHQHALRFQNSPQR